MPCPQVERVRSLFNDEDPEGVVEGGEALAA